MLATFNSTWDWTVVGTLGLAVVALIAVAVGVVALRQNRAAFALSSKEIEEAHRPVLVPLVNHRRMDLAGEDHGVPGRQARLMRPRA